MLIHFTGILCLGLVVDADVPSRLFAISHLKSIIQELQHDLVKFKRTELAELSKLQMKRNISSNDDDACLKMISRAYNETTKMLNMMVEGEHSQLETAETSLDGMTLNELSKLWGSLAPGGASRVKIENEIDNYRKTATARIVTACETKSHP